MHIMHTHEVVDIHGTRFLHRILGTLCFLVQLYFLLPPTVVGLSLSVYGIGFRQEWGSCSLYVGVTVPNIRPTRSTRQSELFRCLSEKTN